MRMAPSLERLFRLDDAGWARHMNPWSVYTRFAALPLLALAAWSRVWIEGFWLGALVGVVLAIWLNPRLFPPPAHARNWGSRGVLGERVWLKLRRSSSPLYTREDRAFVLVLNTLNGLGTVLLLYALYALELRLTLLGMFVAMQSKAWFLDRMVLLYDRAAREAPGVAKEVNPLAQQRD
jgi:hypothetical protein